MPTGRAVPAVRVRHVTEGTYNCERYLTVNQTWASSGAEYEIEGLNLATAATGKDVMFSWIRGHGFLWDAHATQSSREVIAYEWFVLRLEQGASIPDMDDGDTVEALHKQRRVFARGVVSQPPVQNAHMKGLKFELFNVVVPDGEELTLIVRPIAGGTGYGKTWLLLEWRQVGE